MSDFNISDAGNNPAGINQPDSGTYGQKAAQARLEQQLPGPIEPAGPGGAGAPPMPTPGAANPTQASAPGLPSALLRPTSRPDVPASTPLAAPPVNPVAAAQSGRQKRLAVLDAIANSPTVSAQTKEWAQLNLQKLIQGSAR